MAMDMYDKGKKPGAKKSEGIMDKIERRVVSAAAPVKNAIKSTVRSIDSKIQKVCSPNEEYCPYKKGGTVGKFTGKPSGKSGKK